MSKNTKVSDAADGQLPPPNAGYCWNRHAAHIRWEPNAPLDEDQRPCQRVVQFFSVNVTDH
jgi:hypothetical protein